MIPISHLAASNQYPSLSKVPPANIVHSFAPVYTQQHRPQSGSIEGELYNDYANNPYNLTLQMEQNYCEIDSPMATDAEQGAAVSSATATTTTQVTNLNVFQSLNYFGSSSDSAIPPGSELLFGGP